MIGFSSRNDQPPLYNLPTNKLYSLIFGRGTKTDEPINPIYQFPMRPSPQTTHQIPHPNGLPKLTVARVNFIYPVYLHLLPLTPLFRIGRPSSRFVKP